ncbi:hypothetical protein N7540_000240 [Penicillium herquei]|nr:hypothetical protein N7540_000240 [Penicillium herquei]
MELVTDGLSEDLYVCRVCTEPSSQSKRLARDLCIFHTGIGLKEDLCVPDMEGDTGRYCIIKYMKLKKILDLEGKFS